MRQASQPHNRDLRGRQCIMAAGSIAAAQAKVDSAYSLHDTLFSIAVSERTVQMEAAGLLHVARSPCSRDQEGSEVPTHQHVNALAVRTVANKRSIEG